MKYWGYLLAKLLAAGAFLWSVGFAIRKLTPRPPTFWNQRQDPFVHDLTYTTLMMLYFLLSIGLLYLVVWDQRYRCRTCVRKLRMPVAAGSWPNMFLIGQPIRARDVEDAGSGFDGPEESGLAEQSGYVEGTGVA